MPDIIDAWAHGQWKIALLPAAERLRSPAIRALCWKWPGRSGRRWPKAICTITARDESAADDIRRILAKEALDGVEIAVGQTREVLAGSHFAVAVSGTVTLEVAYFGVPMVIFYRTPAIFRLLHKLIGRWCVPTPFFSLVNILAGRASCRNSCPGAGESNR